ncbi:hypothetical protein AAG906_038106 [Vitis piasezkii]
MVGYELEVVGYELKVVGYELEVVGYELEVVGYGLEVEVYELEVEEDVRTSFIQELLHSYIDGIKVSFTLPTAPLIVLSPQLLGHPFRDNVATQMQYFPTPLVEQQG